MVNPPQISSFILGCHNELAPTGRQHAKSESASVVYWVKISVHMSQDYILQARRPQAH